MKKYILTVLVSCFFVPLANALMLENSIIVGKIKSFNDKEIVLVDREGVIHKVSRLNVSPKVRLQQGKEISVLIKVKPEMFQFSNLPMRLDVTKKMPIKSIKEIHEAYIIFLMNLDSQLQEDGTFKKYEKDKVVTELFNVLMEIANAEDEAVPTNFPCFYNGWPTTRSSPNGACTPPWGNAAQTAYPEGDAFHYSTCGNGGGTYRCNPVLFGEGAPRDPAAPGTALGAPTAAFPGTPVKVRSSADPQNGICVVSSSSDVIRKCLTASAPNLGKIIDKIKINPAAFNRFAQSVEAFCSNRNNRSNHACSQLGERLASIKFGQKANQRQAVEGNPTCTKTAFGKFGQSFENSAEPTCPGNTCYVQANCPAATEGAAPLNITAVCGCSKLGPATGPDGVHTAEDIDSVDIVSCVNDQSISVLNPDAALPDNALSPGGSLSH
ncbi:MAG: hypothetical protein HYV97_15015 [Bdellovibrio sp.]|nr:hypothetical protein [Bdellovibrio sp.]